ncbi:FUSC family protein [Paenalcaligenes niemegkensis]|uniref:FUSC family protein n=1 Tax=Paenalcaligenes niemegkensis TaxID=2895469 RepID=UPI001EE85341|nr:FUSC family membrane protein [Paenalcaligenes niemegkensis]MCQ9616955.1 FUSC family protein [Paenalcaligenes niemegkensis]
MVNPIPQLQRFLYSHYLLGGLRQSMGVLLPVIILGGVFKLYYVGVIAAMGAMCVAIVDSPGGPRRYRSNEMLGGVALGTLTVAITGFASGSTWAIWLAIPLLCFSFSMLNVFGKRGSLMGFACLLLMSLTLRSSMESSDVWWHTFYSFIGGLSYFAFSSLFRRILWLREERRVLSMALFATAEYMAARANFYDANTDLDESYRELIRVQSSMSELHQAARDMVLRELPQGRGRGDGQRVRLLSLYTSMVKLLDILIATHTDYTTLRRKLASSDFMEFARDALKYLSVEIGRTALNLSRYRQGDERISVKAEVRAMEYELDRYKSKGFAQEEPEVYALLVQIVRRLRIARQIVEHMADDSRSGTSNIPIEQYLDKSLSRFLSRKELRFGLLTSNLRLSSSSFRYAVRVTVASLFALALPAIAFTFYDAEAGMLNALTSHSHWIIMTIVVILKPGFALTRQRNTWRLMGTALGCSASFIIISLTKNPELYFAAMLIAHVLGNSLVQINYMLSGLFNTIFVLLSFQFVYAGNNFVIGERLLDTFIGCAIALICSYVLPQWEASSMDDFASEALEANKRFLSTGLNYAALHRQLNNDNLRANALLDDESAPQALNAEQRLQLEDDLNEADTQWQLARNQVHIAFNNFSSAFYRMMDEPANRQKNAALFNNLMIQNHVLASQIGAAIPLLATLNQVPAGIAQATDAVVALLDGQEAERVGAIETEGELAMLAYPLRQMIKAGRLIRQDMRGLSYSWGPPAPEHLKEETV